MSSTYILNNLFVRFRILLWSPVWSSCCYTLQAGIEFLIKLLPQTLSARVGQVLSHQLFDNYLIKLLDQKLETLIYHYFFSSLPISIRNTSKTKTSIICLSLQCLLSCQKSHVCQLNKYITQDIKYLIFSYQHLITCAMHVVQTVKCFLCMNEQPNLVPKTYVKVRCSYTSETTGQGLQIKLDSGDSLNNQQTERVSFGLSERPCLTKENGEEQQRMASTSASIFYTCMHGQWHIHVHTYITRVCTHRNLRNKN